MRIRELNQKNFRNLGSPKVTFNDGLNYFFGDNGQGKTNFLEAISLVHHAKSFRPTGKNALVNSDSKSTLARVSFLVQRLGVDYQVAIEIDSGRSKIIVDNKKRNASFLAERFPVVVFSPESLDAIKGGADQRRALVDQALLLIDPTYGKILERFSRTLRTRNKALKDGKIGRMSLEETAELLRSLNPTFLTISTELITKRLDFLRNFEVLFNRTFQSFFGNTHKITQFSYLISSEEAKTWDSQMVHDALQKRVLELSQFEVASGVSLAGPQKNELVFLVNDKDSRYFCSQGQQRSLILSFKMAQIMYHYTAYGDCPVLLLDDVLSELDGSNRQSLVAFLNGLNAQIFLTATEVGQEADNLFCKQKPSFYEIKNGIIERFSEGYDEERANHGEPAQ